MYGWSTRGFSTLTAVAPLSQYEGAFLRTRIGAISELKGIRYWSTTHKENLDRRCICDQLSNAGKRRWISRRMKSEGANVCFQQTDNLSGKRYTGYISGTPDRLVIETENLTTMCHMLYPLFHPGELQTIYFRPRIFP
jgi:hypothetical protein